MKLGLLKALILGLGITFISSGMAFASTEIQPTSGVAQDSVQILRGEGSTPVMPTEPVLYDDGNSASVSYGIDPELVKLQNQIDIFFKENFVEIRDMGFTFTHTAPVDGIVEIGITPYSEDAAKYLYDKFGKAIVVVEGKQAVLMGTEPSTLVGAEPAVAPDYIRTSPDKAEEAKMEIQILNAEDGVTSDADLAATTGLAGSSEIRTLSANAERDDAKAESTIPMTTIYALGALVLLGGIALIMKKSVVSIKK